MLGREGENNRVIQEMLASGFSFGDEKTSYKA